MAILLSCIFVPNALSYQVSVSWDSTTLTVDGEPLAAPAHYRLHYGTKSQHFTQVLDTGATTHAIITNLTEGVRYCFAVTAYNAENGESIYSSEQWSELPAPDSDSDGIDDAHELELGTDPHRADSDSDGMRDGDELKCHTDPLDTQDVLVASLLETTPDDNTPASQPAGSASPGTTESVVLAWQAKADLTYIIQTSADLLTWSTAPSGTGSDEKSPQTALSNGQLTYRLPLVSESGPRFYRVCLAP